MSRVGKKPIPIPPGVQVNIEGSNVTVTGPRGQLTRELSPEIGVSLDNGILTVTRPTESRRHRALHGLTRTLVANMVLGVSTGFQKSLDIVGVGYRAQKTETKVVLQLGYSHPIEIIPPPGLELAVEGTNRLTVIGVDQERVGQMAANIRSLRPPEPYKGKGIRYRDEQVRRKAGKAGKAGGRK
ncbi:MAG: 50S ribosomal protein L6 [Chloroflexi bacterium]|nr:50S ribosomal protein L6 [Chloroflexota bacterium]